MRRFVCLAACLLWFLGGCMGAKKAYMDHSPPMEMSDEDVAYGYGEEMDYEEEPMYEMSRSLQSRQPKKKSGARSSSSSTRGEPAPASAPPMVVASPGPTPDAKPAAKARMVHYSGSASLRVIREADAADAIGDLAKAAGGKVESLGAQSIVIRVPVDRFDAVFAQVLAMGEVVSKTVSAEDLTEAFQSTDLRLRTARTTRDRLVVLLAKAEDEEEKLELVRQIQRLTQEIDRLDGQVRTLSALANLSRISVQLIPREALAHQGPSQETRELSWIRGLNPFERDVVSWGRKVVLPVPDGLVDLKRKGRFVAESADGVRVWTGRLVNEPRGDGEFWIAAVEGRVARDFASAERSELGAWTLLTLVDRADEPYTWVIGVRANGAHLDVVEVFYPAPAQRERHEAAIHAVLADGGAA